MREYAFADPAIIRAIYDPGRSLEERTMLLEARFHGLRFHIGVRVSGVVDETRDHDGRPVRVGFRLFGRREQVRFARRAGERMAALVEAELEAGAGISEPLAVA